MNITPLQDYILLEEVQESETKSGIILTDDSDIEKPNIATVVKKGSDVALKIKEADSVLFKRHLFDEIVLDGIKYLLGREEGICAIINA